MQQKRVSPEEARALLEAAEGYTYIDVRTAEEFAAGHVPGAVNIPVLVRRPGGAGMEPNPGFLDDVKGKFAPEARLITGCQRGGRSLRAAEILAAAGFTNVVDMRGGYDGELDPAGNVTYPGWARRGLPTTRG
jgi:rhodanese-related sulfurtransferase